MDGVVRELFYMQYRNRGNINQAFYALLESSLILISTILVAIWAMQHTIALRNVLLVIGFILSCFYIKKLIKDPLVRFELKNLMPIILIGILFLWVVVHFLFLSEDKSTQFKELRSTWVRCFLGAFLGWVLGFIVARNPVRVCWLGWGLFSGFAVLYGQYIYRSYYSFSQVKTLDYIFFGKINGVLVGTILIAGAGGRLLDQLHAIKVNKSFLSPIVIIFILVGMLLYSYVYILRAKNGIVLTFSLMLFWVVWVVVEMVKLKFQHIPATSITFRIKAFTFIAVLILFVITIFFSKLHIDQDQSWLNLVEDIQESFHIDKYPQWLSPQTMGYPILPSGRQVTENVFERVSWAIAGLQLTHENIFGIGILHHPFGRILFNKFPSFGAGVLPGSTHSGWLDLTLSFGLPALVLLWGSLLCIARIALNNKSRNKGFTLSLLIGIFCLYSLGELSNNHAVEIMIFSITFLAGMNAFVASNNNQADNMQVI